MNKQTIDLGLDIGYGNTKGVLNKNTNIYFPSRVTETLGRSINGASAQHFEYKDKHWLVGQHAIYAGNREKVKVDSYFIHEDKYAVLVLYAIERLKLKGANKVRVATGLPVEYYQNHSETLKKLYSKLSPSMLDVRVLPQPYGTLLDIMYDWNGKPVMPELAKEKIAIIDIGYGTIDAIGVNHNLYNPTEAMQENEGVSLLSNEIQSHMLTKFNKNINQADILSVIEQGGTKVKGKFRNLEPFIKQAKEKRMNAIIAIINKLWNGLDNLDHVVCTGGGAKLLEEELMKKIGQEQLIIPTNPWLSNASGFAKGWRVPGWG